MEKPNSIPELISKLSILVKEQGNKPRHRTYYYLALKSIAINKDEKIPNHATIHRFINKMLECGIMIAEKRNIYIELKQLYQLLYSYNSACRYLTISLYQEWHTIPGSIPNESEIKKDKLIMWESRLNIKERRKFSELKN